MGSTNRTKRNIGLDIFRILSMCGIVGLHVMNNGGGMTSADLYDARYPFLLAVLSIFFLSVNSFALLSGYLLIEKKQNNLKRIIELLAIVVFFVVVETIVFYTFNIKNVRSAGVEVLAKSLFPFGFGYYWYITCYIFLFFMMPYINHFVTTISKNTYKKLLITVGILLSIIPNLFMQTDFFHIEDGYSPFWLMFCYLLGGYIKLYPLKIKTKKCIVYFVVTIVVMAIANYAWRLIANLVFGQDVRSSWIISYTSPLNLFASALLLILFSRSNIRGSFARFLIPLSAAAFSVYIFHDQYLFYRFILEGRFSFTNTLPVFVQILIILGGIVGIYILGFIAECIRKLIFKYLGFNKLIVFLSSKLEERNKEKINAG